MKIERGVPERRAEYLETCFETFCKNGLENTSMQVLADACGTATANLVYYFGTKDNLIIEVTAHGMAKVEDDFMAQGALVTLHDNGIRVPDDVELLAFGMQSNDNMNYLIPSITTVSLPYMKMMESCVEILMDSIADSSLAPRTQMVAPEVMIRKSFSI